MPKVSIIVPVYNCREYLSKCIGSVLAQTLSDWELILVDDGSSDGSGAVCDGFAEKDSRIRAIHQENGGVSAARNAGLAAAKGEYIGFLDADDTFCPQTLEIALDAMGERDMVMFDAVTVWEDGNTEADTISGLGESCLLEKKDMTPALLLEMAGAVWRCVYRRALIGDVRFPVGIKLSEDRLFNLAAMGKAKTIRYVKQGLYLRTMRQGSAVNRYHGDKFEKNLLAMDIAEEAIEKYWGDGYLPVYTRMFVIRGALDAIYEICSREFPGKSRRKAIGEITGHQALAKAFSLCPPEGLREKLLEKKANAALAVLGIGWNLKNGR